MASSDVQGFAFTRKKNSYGFSYFSRQGKIIKSRALIRRLNSLAVPPAYTDVWYSKSPKAKLQAIARDAKGRKQYRYNPDFIEKKQKDKYGKLKEFAKALPLIRRQTAKDMKRKGLPREKVLACVVQLLEKSLIRVGNDRYAKENRSYGLTTLKNQHAEVKGHQIRFKFKGKSAIQHEIQLKDPRLAEIVKRCKELPGHEIFEYLDAQGKRHDVKSQDINQYLKEITGKNLTAKDFRTWAGTVLAIDQLSQRTFASDRECKRHINEALECVSGKLGNTKAVCRKAYVHPKVIESFCKGELKKTNARRKVPGLSKMECQALQYL